MNLSGLCLDLGRAYFRIPELEGEDSAESVIPSLFSVLNDSLTGMAVLELTGKHEM